MDWPLLVAEWVQANPVVGGFVFIAAFSATLAIGFPGGLALFLIGGFLFGPMGGTLLAMAAAMLAASLTWLAIDTSIGKWLRQRSDHWREKWFLPLKADSRLASLTVPRLVPVIPFFVINVYLAAVGVPFRRYFLTTFIGTLPVAILANRIGAAFATLDQAAGVRLRDLLQDPGFWAPLLILIILALVAAKASGLKHRS